MAAPTSAGAGAGAAAAPRPMNIIEKIIAHHGVGLTRAWVAPGEAVCVRVDWTMANELTLVGISDMWTKIGRRGLRAMGRGRALGAGAADGAATDSAATTAIARAHPRQSAPIASWGR